MVKLYKIAALALALLTAVCAFTGCKKHQEQDANNTNPPALPTSNPNTEATELPEWMWTPDPALFILGEDGFFEDQYLTANWPAYLEYQYSMASNCAQYIGYPEGSQKKLVFSYTPDEGGDYEAEMAHMDFDSFEKFIQEQMNLYFYLEEFDYIRIDGHRALRAVYNYDPPGEPEHYTRVLQYSIEVNGWIMGLCFSTQLEEFPEECFTCINTIHFKDGY